MTTEQAPILVVEDDEHISQLLQFMLERQGHRVQLLTDGLAASKAIEALPAPPRLILLDVMLPYIDGIAIVSLIRARPGWGAVPIILLTAKQTEQDIVRALDAGADDYIVKPFQPNELLARIRRHIKEAT